MGTQAQPLASPSDRASGREGFLRIFWAALRRNPLALTGLFILAALIVTLLLAPVLPLRDPAALKPALRLTAWFTTTAYPLGTDELGRDILSRIIWGGRVSLWAGIASAGISMGFGLVIGLAAGYKGKLTDLLSMRLIDILLAFPPLILAIAVVAGLGPGLRNAVIVLGVIGIPIYARVVRGVVLSLKEYPFIEAARALGASDVRIVTRHVLPNILGPIIVLFTLDVGQKIVFMAGLSFIGLGTQPPTADWGAMLAASKSYITSAPHAATAPGIAILIVVLSLNLLGDGLRDALDPRLSRS